MSGHGRFLPFNLSTIVPFEATAAALGHLPTIQPRAPAAASLMPQLLAKNEAPTPEMTQLMQEILTDAVRDGEWMKLDDAPAHQDGSMPAWMVELHRDMERAVEEYAQAATPTRGQVPSRAQKRPRGHVNGGDKMREQRNVSASKLVVPAENQSRNDQTAVWRANDERQDDEEARQERDAKNRAEEETRKEFLVTLRAFVERVESFTERLHGSESQAQLRATSSQSYLEEMARSFEINGVLGYLADAPEEDIRSIIDALNVRIRSASSTARRVSSRKTDSSVLAECVLGCCATQALLSLITTKDIARALLMQDVLDDIADLLRLVLTKIVYPDVDAMFTVPSSESGRSKQSKKQASRNVPDAKVKPGTACGTRDTVGRLDASEADDVSGADLETNVSSGGGSPTQEKLPQRPAHKAKQIQKISRLCVLNLDRLSVLLAEEGGLTESFVSQLVSLAISSLSVSNNAQIQIICCKVVEAAVASYPSQEISCLDLICEQAGKLPPNRRGLRSYRVDKGAKSIRVSTAMLLRALSAIGGREPMLRKSKCPVPHPDESRNRVMRIALRFVDETLDRCFRERDVEQRAAVLALYEDLLETYGLVDWPGCAFVVQAFAWRFVTMVNKANEHSVFARSTAIDMLGNLLAKLCGLYGVSVLKTSESFELSTAVGVSSLPNQTELMRQRVLLVSYLQQRSQEELAAKYAVQFHRCLFDVDNADAVVQAEQTKGSLGSDASNPNASGALSKEQILALRSTAIATSSQELRDMLPVLGNAMTEHDLSLVEEASLCTNRIRPFVRQLPTVLKTVLAGLTQPEPTLRTRSIRAFSAVIEICPTTLSCVPELLHAVEASCMDVSKSVREASLDLLGKSILTVGGNEDISNMNDSDSKVSMQTRPADAKTRAENVWETFEKVISIAQPRLLDSATSVRKRAISILHSVLALCEAENKLLRRDLARRGSSPNHFLDSIHCDIESAREPTGHRMEKFEKHDAAARDLSRKLEKAIVRMCGPLAERLFDKEASVKEAAERSLRFALLGFDVARLDAPDDYETDVSLFATRLVGVFVWLRRSLRSGVVLDGFLGKVLHDTLLNKRRILLSAIVDNIVEIMHTAEARCADFPASEAGRNRTDAEPLLLQRLGCSSALQAFARVDHKLLASHCQTLAPAIKSVTGLKPNRVIDVHHVQCILNILELGIPSMGKISSSPFLEEVVRDIERVVCQCPTPSIAQAAIKALCVLCNHSDIEDIHGLPADTARMFFEFLDGCKEDLVLVPSPLSVEQQRNAKEALVRLGLLARFGECNEDEVSHIYDLLAFLCRKMIDTIDQVENRGDRTSTERMYVLRLRAVRALTHFLVGNRKYIPAATSTLLVCLRQGQSATSSGDCALCPALDYDLQVAVLAGLKDLLVQEESRNVTASTLLSRAEKAAGRQGPRHDIVLAAEDDADAGFLAACAQALVPELIRASSSANIEVRRVVVGVLELLARQGLVLPAKIVPAVFGLLVDGHGPCRETAVQVVSFLADRYPGMLSSASLEGLRTCYFHARATGPRAGENGTSVVNLICSLATDTVTGYAHVSTAIDLIKREQRRTILSNILREFDPKARTVVCNSTPEQDSQFPDASFGNGGVLQIGSCPEKDAQDKIHTAVTSGSAEGGAENPQQQSDMFLRQPLVKLQVTGTTLSCANLIFLCASLATLDYAGGAGLAGSLTVGGGTATSDAKLKVAREDVGEMTSVVNRIASNSGQAVLEAAHRLSKATHVRPTEKEQVASAALPVTMLLTLKKFLLITRWSAGHGMDGDDVGGESPVQPPKFEFPPSMFFPITRPNGRNASQWTEAGVQSTLDLFEELMLEDKTNAEDDALPSRKRPAWKSGPRRPKKRARVASRMSSGTRKGRRRPSGRRTVSKVPKLVPVAGVKTGDECEDSDYDGDGGECSSENTDADSQHVALS